MKYFTLPLVSLPTMYGEMKPGQQPNKPQTPRITPEKFGDMSMTLANMPAETAPCEVVAMVRNTKAAVELHPEYARAMVKNP